MRRRLGDWGRALATYVGLMLIGVCVDILLTDFFANLTAWWKILAAIIATCRPVGRLGINIRTIEIYIAGQLAGRGSNGVDIGEILFCRNSLRGWHSGQMVW
jgi:hypothetical protein